MSVAAAGSFAQPQATDEAMRQACAVAKSTLSVCIALRRLIGIKQPCMCDGHAE
jgi:hypothetical protein